MMLKSTPPINIIMNPAVPPEKLPYSSALHVTPTTLPPPISAVKQLGSPITVKPVIKKLAAPKVPRNFQIITTPYFSQAIPSLSRSDF